MRRLTRASVLSGKCQELSGILGALIGSNEATLALDKFHTFTAISCSCAKRFTLSDLFAFPSTLRSLEGLRCQTYICIIHLYSHLLKGTRRITPLLEMLEQIYLSAGIEQT